MNINQLIARLFWIGIAIGIIVIAIFSQGCAIKARIIDPNEKVYLYHGPKDVDYMVKKGDLEIKFSGKNESFWAGILKFLLLKAPDVNVIK